MPSYGTNPTQDPQQRLAELQDEFTRFPGAAPGGTGLTGLGKHDAQGYSQLLGRQQEYLNLIRQLNGQGPMNVRFGGVMPSQTGISPATGLNNARSFGLPANVSGMALQGLQQAKGGDQIMAGLDQFRARMGYR